MPNLTPFATACPPRPLQQQSENYAENLHHSLENELSTIKGAAQFLATTYPTEAMLSVAKRIFNRLAHGEASLTSSIYRFNSQFGGGKTHTLIALAAMALHPQAAATSDSEFSAFAVPDGIKLVTFSGDEANPISGQSLPGTSLTARSITGVLAYQLGGEALLKRYQKEDNLLTSAGADAYKDMIGKKPVLILIDELANYVAKAGIAQADSLKNTDVLLFDLIQAVTVCPKAVLVITSPDPNSDAFRSAVIDVMRILDDAQKVVGRNAEDITPTASRDLAPILRRRLFQNCDDNARQETATAYRELYARHYPAQTADFTQQISDSYPFHPLLLELINTRLAENDKFQRVRGTLRLLASMIVANSDSESSLLHPHHIDPAADYFTNELNSRLEQGSFTAAIQTDITGDNATVGDASKNPMPKYVATTILLGSLAPSASRGLSRDFINRAILSPEHPDPGAVGDAINTIYSRAIYINTEESENLRFSSEPNIRNDVDQKRRDIQRDINLVDEFVKRRLQAHFAPNSATSQMETHIFPSPGDIPDSAQQTQLAIINPRFCNQQSANRIDDLRKIFSSSDSLNANATRQYRNNIVILLAQSNNWPNIQDYVVTQLAAQSIKDSPPQGTTEANLAELRSIIDRAETLITQEIQSHWTEIYYPSVHEQVADGLQLRHVSMSTGTTHRSGQQDVIDCLTTNNKIPPPEVPMVAREYWESLAVLKDPSNPPTIRQVQEEIARTPRQLMALNYNSIKATVGLAAQREELALRTVGGMKITDAALMRDDAVIYITGNEPQDNSADTSLPVIDDIDKVEPDPQDPSPAPLAPIQETTFNETGYSANQVVASLDAFMAQQGYSASDMLDITIRGAEEPMLNYLAGVFTGLDAEFAYHSAGNGFEVLIKASDVEYSGKRNYWARFSNITGDKGDATMRVRPNSPEQADTIQARLRQLDGQYTIDLQVRFRAKS